MAESRIDKALARIEAALARMDAAHAQAIEKAMHQATKKNDEDGAADSGGSTRVMELVNAHEKLREEVADSLRELDTLIGELEG